jgi:hypothetical protein
MDTQIADNVRCSLVRNLLGAAALVLAGSAASCTNPGYRTEVYPGQQGQYTLQHVPEPVQPAAPPAPAPAPVAATMPADENLSQVEAVWPKLNDSDKALLAETAKHLAAQR